MNDDSDLIFSRNKPASAVLSDSAGSWWTIPLLCVGLGIIACCVIIPACDANRKVLLEREKLQRDLTAVDQQIEVNDTFLKRVSRDPELSERLAQRQMKFIRQGSTVLNLGNQPAVTDPMSPFLLTAMPRPAPLATAPPLLGGLLGRVSGSAKLQLYAIGFGLLLLAAGLVCGGPEPTKR